jgi:hypothetical protein
MYVRRLEDCADRDESRWTSVPISVSVSVPVSLPRKDTRNTSSFPDSTQSANRRLDNEHGGIEQVKKKQENLIRNF